MKFIIAIASTLAILAVGSGHLPKMLRQVHLAQMKLLKCSQTKSWGRAWIPAEIEKEKP